MISVGDELVSHHSISEERDASEERDLFSLSKSTSRLVLAAKVDLSDSVTEAFVTTDCTEGAPRWNAIGVA